MTINKIKLNTAVVDNNDLGKKMFLAASGALMITLSLYVFFVGKTIVNIIHRKAAESEVRSLSAQVSNLEIQYISLAKNIDLDMAKTLGFSESKDTYFAARRSTVGALATTANEL
jgi:hypothetical protein